MNEQITAATLGDGKDIVYDTPIITHEQCKRYTGQYRNVHVIADSFNDNLKVTLGIQ